MTRILIATLFLSLQFYGYGQKYFTKSGTISFFSKTDLENIDAASKSAVCVLDAATGKMEWSVLIKGFQFEKALMQEHFNENYMESDKFPKAIFKGTIQNFNKININTNGKHKVMVDGDLTIHGVTKKISSAGTLEIKDGKILTASDFDITISDYGISIPNLVKDNIAKVLKIKVSGTLESLKS